MKQGSITQDPAIDTTLTKKHKVITKSLEQLLVAVFNENDEDFRAYLKQENITTLDLSRKVRDQNLSPLLKALQGTSITTINLRWNNIGPEGAKDLGLALKDNQCIRHIDLRENNIGTVGTNALAESIPYTRLMKIPLDSYHLPLIHALELNRKK